MKELCSNKCEFSEFGGLTEFSDFLELGKANSLFSDGEGCSSQEDSEEYAKFSGTHSWEESMEIMRNGYHEGAANILAAKGVSLDSFKRDAEAYKQKVDYAGSRPHIVNSICGMPKTMINRKKQMKQQKYIHLYYNISCPCNITQKEINKAGKNLLALVKYYESVHIRVALSVMFAAAVEGSQTENSHIRGCIVSIKNYDQPLNILSVAYPIVHPSFLRRQIFKWIETAKCMETIPSQWQWQIRDGHGYAVHEKTFKGNLEYFLKTSGIIQQQSVIISAMNLKECENVQQILAAIKE